MIVMHMDLEPGYRKADINNIPMVRSETIFGFVTKIATSGGGGKKQQPASSNSNNVDLRVDFVQVRRAGDVFDLRAVVFPAATGGNHEAHINVDLKVDEKKDEISETKCDQCTKKESCPHILAFIFWLHRKSTDTDAPAIRDYWGSEIEALAEEERVEALRIRDIFACDELRLEADLEAAAVSEPEGQAFFDTVLDEMENLGLRDSALYRHCRSVLDEFEPLFIHHIMLDASNNGVKDSRSFVQHMEDQAKEGLFERLAEVSKTSYKTPIWLETQYMRLRCSLIHRVASRKDSLEDENIIDLLFCKEREYNAEEKQQLKQHKRFILKQTEKLENKTYSECGLLLNESYPYICASPDGITDDHIVEIKAPKTDEEFEKYLEGRETIAPKYMAQIQIQMYMANVTKALYCVLSPTFDTNGALHYVWVQADMEFVASLLGAAEDFWKDVVFPRLVKIYLSSP
ncbi:PREDICTED: uncharacterized protein LOC108373040 [Rhagoletis zephyria]|uniref:uncharacterized protein LOC108373040 n=1 Tax=Rhagoletis zephyria TaxID=28612 RepID=UPI000811A1BE|nr:PREDICTED: uncharacterized protein LOC108373040 [Rhagoletis zephyria]XP_036343675.1 uncharacterized protein LOC118752933 [Rhagoletis pomonella]